MKRMVFAATAALLFVAAFALAGCQGPSQTFEEIAEEAGAASPESIESPLELPSADAGGATYLISSYSIPTDSGGVITWEWDYDTDGSCLTSKRTAADGSARAYESISRDEHGADLEQSVTEYAADGSVENSAYSTYDNLYDGDLLASATDDDGFQYVYTYHDNGVVAQIENSQGYVARFDEQGRRVFYDGGMLNDDRGALTIEWDDAIGYGSGFTASFADGETYHFSTAADASGNLASVTDEYGNRLAQATYERIDNPCPTCRVYGLNRVGTFMVINSIEEFLD